MICCKDPNEESYESSSRCCSFGISLFFSRVAVGKIQPLTLDQVPERARTRAPSTLAARDRIEKARGRLLGAKVLLRDNPILEFSGGPRYTPGLVLIDAEIGLSQLFELGSRRKSWITAAEA